MQIFKKTSKTPKMAWLGPRNKPKTGAYANPLWSRCKNDKKIKILNISSCVFAYYF